eukprot:5100700-Pyramimonas_sp.AAC.1
MSDPESTDRYQPMLLLCPAFSSVVPARRHARQSLKLEGCLADCSLSPPAAQNPATLLCPVCDDPGRAHPMHGERLF